MGSCQSTFEEAGTRLDEDDVDLSFVDVEEDQFRKDLIRKLHNAASSSSSEVPVHFMVTDKFAHDLGTALLSLSQNAVAHNNNNNNKLSSLSLCLEKVSTAAATTTTTTAVNDVVREEDNNNNIINNNCNALLEFIETTTTLKEIILSGHSNPYSSVEDQEVVVASGTTAPVMVMNQFIQAILKNKNLQKVSLQRCTVSEDVLDQVVVYGETNLTSLTLDKVTSSSHTEHASSSLSSSSGQRLLVEQNNNTTTTTTNTTSTSTRKLEILKLSWLQDSLVEKILHQYQTSSSSSSSIRVLHVCALPERRGRGESGSSVITSNAIQNFVSTHLKTTTTSSTLDRLELKGFQFTQELFAPIVQGIINNTTTASSSSLTSLSFSDIYFDVPSQYLFESLFRQPNHHQQNRISKLSISNCAWIAQSTGTALSAIIRTTTTNNSDSTKNTNNLRHLQELELDYWSLGFDLLATLESKQHTLHKLNVGWINPDCWQGKALIQSISKWQNIRHLTIGFCGASFWEYKESIVQAFEKNGSLEHVELLTNNETSGFFNAREKELIQSYCQRNKSIRQLLLLKSTSTKDEKDVQPNSIPDSALPRILHCALETQNADTVFRSFQLLEFCK